MTKGTLRRAFLYSFAFAAVAVAVVNALDVMTWVHEKPGSALVAPIVAAGTSGISFMLFFWIPWCAWLWAPPFVRPRWKLLIHIPAALVFALAHISGFILLRWLAAWAPGIPNLTSPLAAQFLYDAPKDALSYILFGAGFALVGRLLRRSTLAAGEPAGQATYDIRDGAKLTRVRLDQILVIASAGNYVEFTLADGRTLLMRSPLAAVEREFAPRGFVRTHRSRLVNAARVTALKPEGSGDYIVELGSCTAPLSRRFPEALARLRDGRQALGCPVQALAYASPAPPIVWFPQPEGSGVTLDNKAYGVHRGASVRVDLAHSVRRLRMAAICAKRTLVKSAVRPLRGLNQSN